jgi:hypothetical protein
MIDKGIAFKNVPDPIGHLGRGGLSVVGGGAAAAVPWYLSGGVLAANCVGAYQAIGAANIGASYSNLANPGTHDLTTTAAPTFAAETGWEFDGATTYLETGIIPLGNQAQSMFCRFSDLSGNNCVCGLYEGAGKFYLGPNVSSHFYLCNGVTESEHAPYLTTGVVGFGGLTVYRNGVVDGADLGAESPAYGISINIGRRNKVGGGPDNYTVGKIQAVAIYNVAVTQAQALAISSAMTNLGAAP